MGILRRGYAFDRSQRLHVVRRNGSSPPVPLPFYGTFRLPFLLHSRTSAFQEKTASACPKGKEPSKGRAQLHAPQEYRCFFRLRRDTLSFLTLFSSLQSPPAVSTGCTSCVGEIRSSSCPAALLSLPGEERNGTPASTGRIGRLLHDSFLQILLQICPYLLRSPFRSHFGHIAVHHQVDKLFKAGTVRIPSEFSLRLRRVAP